MIHVCFALHDANGTYAKYLGAAICSLLIHTRECVCIYLLHDDTLHDAERKKFVQLCEKWKQKIYFMKLDRKALMDKVGIHPVATIGTLFRLRLVELLPESVTRVIYLDADLIFNLDIVELWNENLSGCLIGARRDAEGKRWMCDQGILPRDMYFNAGVMVLDIEKIRRERDLFCESMDFFVRYPNCRFADQDALNYIFQGKVAYLPDRYNFFTIQLRNNNNLLPQKAIYHFAGDVIHVHNPMFFDTYFFSALCESPWGRGEEICRYVQSIVLEKQKTYDMLRYCMSRIANRKCKRVIFGAKSELLDEIQSFIHLEPDKDYYVDNAADLQGHMVNGVQVESPECLKGESRDNIFVIVLSCNHYYDIREQLMRYGLSENVDFIDGRALLSGEKGGYLKNY